MRLFDVPNSPLNGELFDRIAKVTVYRQPTSGGSTGTGFFTQFFDTLGNGIEITDLRIQFEIEKKIGKHPNTCTITITNCSELTRAELQRKPLFVRIEAGYDGVTRLLFDGDLFYGSSKRVGADWETKLQLVDGGRAYKHAQVNKSYKSGTTIKTILTDAAKSMDLEVPREILSQPDINARIPVGETLVGPTRDALTRMLAPLGYSWSIQNGNLQILKDGQANSNESRVISQENGLIGTPEYGVPQKGKLKNKPILTFENLLYPELGPGGLVDLQSESAKGSHRIQGVKHTGDTAGGDWKTTVEALKL